MKKFPLMRRHGFTLIEVMITLGLFVISAR